MNRHERAGAALSELSRIMERLRAPDGCPWDREQTLASLTAYLQEECFELIEAIESGGIDQHREELGDVLLQVVFQSQIRAEEEAFDLAAVTQTIADKLMRRHPHVFGEARAQNAQQVQARWESIKASERAAKGEDPGRLSGVPRALPALLRAYRIGQKASSAGFDWPSAEGAWQKLREELDELSEAMAGNDRAHLEEELGDALFALCNVARHANVEPERALRAATQKFQRRFEMIEAELDRRGECFEDTSLDRLEGLWELAKSRGR